MGKISVYALPAGRICPSRDVLEGGQNFCLPAARTMSPASHRVELPVWAFLVDHPHGPVLMDTGWPRSLEGDGWDPERSQRLLGPALARFFRPSLPPGEGAVEGLKSLGLAPGDLKCLLISHLDLDHCAAIDELSRAGRILCSQEEYWWSCRTVHALRQPRRLWLRDGLETFWFRGRGQGPTGRSFDLLGDGSMELIELPGHTEGLFALRIRGERGFVILASDGAYTQGAWKGDEVPGFGFDKLRQRKSLKWLSDQSREPDCLGIYPSHDGSIGPGLLAEI